MKKLSMYVFMLLVAIAAPVNAGSVVVPNTFAAGMPAVAAEVNANFTAVKAAIDDNDSRLAILEAAVAALQADLVTANAVIVTLQSQLATLNGSNVMALDPYLTVDTASDDRGPLIQFSGVNVQIVNGIGSTGSINGLGNLIVGYDAPRATGVSVCNDGQHADQASCEAAGGVWAQSHKSGSHNIVGGDESSYSSYGGLVAGRYNVINGTFASVSGGAQNNASTIYSSVSGGAGNTASGGGSSVSGGQGNKASGYYASIGGGSYNIASGNMASVSGGYFGVASGLNSSTGGGQNNTASGAYANVVSGYNNTAAGGYSSILGGSSQATSTAFQTIPALP